MNIKLQSGFQFKIVKFYLTFNIITFKSENWLRKLQL